jgi:hypothetical protein
MDESGGAGDHDLRQRRLASFGRVLASMCFGFVGLNACISLWLGQASFNRASVPLLVAASAFGALWLLLRGAPRSSPSISIRRSIRTERGVA